MSESRSTTTSPARAQFEEWELAAVLAHYDVGIVERHQDFPRGSHESAKRLLHTTRGRFLVKRRPRGKDDPYRVAFSHELQNYLAAKSFPLPHLVGTRESNNSMLKHEGAIYEVYEFIPGEGFDHTSAAAREAGRTLALFHRLVHDMPTQYEPSPGNYHDSERVRSLLKRIEEQLPTSAGAPSARGQDAVVSQVVNRLRAAYDISATAAREAGIEAWERQIVHSDWHPGNLLFHDRRIVAVLDFDSARIQPPVTDLANGALQFSMLTGGRDPDQWSEACDLERFAAFTGGYDETRTVSVAELNVMPALMCEALIGEAVGPIAANGHFARLDGLAFLRTILRKVNWIREHAERLTATVL